MLFQSIHLFTLTSLNTIFFYYKSRTNIKLHSGIIFQQKSKKGELEKSLGINEWDVNNLFLECL